MVITGELREAVLQAERALLGCILIYSSDGAMEAIDHCRTQLTPDDFIDFKYPDPDNIHSRIYQAMLKCSAPHQLQTAIKMSELNLLRNKDISYLLYCVESAPCGLAYDDYCQIVKQYSMQRLGIRKPKVIGILYE
jgi:replicative DNA helicase